MVANNKVSIPIYIYLIKIIPYRNQMEAQHLEVIVVLKEDLSLIHFKAISQAHMSW